MCEVGTNDEAHGVGIPTLREPSSVSLLSKRVALAPWLAGRKNGKAESGGNRKR